MAVIRFRFRIDQQSSTRAPSTRLNRSLVRPDHGHCSSIFKCLFFCLLSIHPTSLTYFTWSQQTAGQMCSFFNGSWCQTTGQEGKKETEKVSQAPMRQKAQTPL